MERCEWCLCNEKMIRSRRKIEAVIHNARCFMKVQEEFGTFSDYLCIWGIRREVFRQRTGFPMW